MMKWILLYLKMAGRYLKYYWRAQTLYDTHSPFIFELAKAVLEDGRYFYAFRDIEQLRSLLLRDHTIIHVRDYGAGSRLTGSSRRKVRSLARHSAVSPRLGSLLFRLVLFTKPGNMLELGTSLGFSTAYQSCAARRTPFFSIEGCPETARLAAQHLRQVGVPAVHLLVGPFEEQLPGALKNFQQLDYLYLDGDHRSGASLRYFEQCLELAHADSVFIIADIHWSKEMEQAWERMKKHPRVRISVDLYQIGLLFFREEAREKQHFTLIRSKYKPWRMGFF